MLLSETQIKEILNRSPVVLKNNATGQQINQYIYTGEEQLSLIQTFIKEKTNRDPGEIQVPRGELCPSFIDLAIKKGINPMIAMQKASDIDGMQCAFNVAFNYYWNKINAEKD